MREVSEKCINDVADVIKAAGIPKHECVRLLTMIYQIGVCDGHIEAAKKLAESMSMELPK